MPMLAEKHGKGGSIYITPSPVNIFQQLKEYECVQGCRPATVILGNFKCSLV
jgi:hypothetical protein